MIDPRLFNAANATPRPLTDALRKEWIDHIIADNKRLSNSYYNPNRYTAIDWYSNSYVSDKAEFLFRLTAAWKAVLKNSWFLLLFIFFAAFAGKDEGRYIIVGAGLLVLALIYAYYHRKFTRESWRFSVSEEGFRFNGKRHIRGLDFKDVLCVFHKTSAGEQKADDYLVIYYAFEGNRYKCKEIELDYLREDPKKIAQIVNFYWQKYLKNKA
jgi:hypothetical protein